jgi:hypothetical protein
MAARLRFGSSFDGIPSKHRPVNLFAWLGRLTRVSGAVPDQVIRAVELADAMVDVAIIGRRERLL